MSTKVQLDLFIEEDEVSLLRKEVRDLSMQQEKFKRTLYGRHRELSTLCLQLKAENEFLKSRLERLESVLNTQSHVSNDDLLERLFKEAYLLSP